LPGSASGRRNPPPAEPEPEKRAAGPVPENKKRLSERTAFFMIPYRQSYLIAAKIWASSAILVE